MSYRKLQGMRGTDLLVVLLLSFYMRHCRYKDF